MSLRIGIGVMIGGKRRGCGGCGIWLFINVVQRHVQVENVVCRRHVQVTDVICRSAADQASLLYAGRVSGAFCLRVLAGSLSVDLSVDFGDSIEDVVLVEVWCGVHTRFVSVWLV